MKNLCEVVPIRQRVINGLVVGVMLVSIIGLGYVSAVMVPNRDWVAIAEAPVVKGFKIIDELPSPFKLNYPGAARVWVYQQQGDDIYLLVVFYQQESQAGELVSSENGFLDRERWRHDLFRGSNVVIRGEEISMTKAVYHAPRSENIVAFSQYRFAGFSGTSSSLVAKLYALTDAMDRTNGSSQVSVIYAAGRLSDDMNNQAGLINLPEQVLVALDDQLRQR